MSILVVYSNKMIFGFLDKFNLRFPTLNIVLSLNQLEPIPNAGKKANSEYKFEELIQGAKLVHLQRDLKIEIITYPNPYYPIGF